MLEEQISLVLKQDFKKIECYRLEKKSTGKKKQIAQAGRRSGGC